MNEHFVCYSKIDREERPDLDNIYMDSSASDGIAGWLATKMSFWCQIKNPFMAAPIPNTQWKNLLANIATAFESHEIVAESAEAGQLIESQRDWKIWNCCGAQDLDPMNLPKVDRKSSAHNLIRNGEEWIRIPNFPDCLAIWAFVLGDYALLAKNEGTSREKFFLPFERCGMGGIYDQLEGGFRVIPFDGEWFAPHFRKRWG